MDPYSEQGGVAYTARFCQHLAASVEDAGLELAWASDN